MKRYGLCRPAFLLWSLLCPASLAAQGEEGWLTVGARGTLLDARSVVSAADAGVDAHWRGPLVGGEIQLAVGPLALLGEYSQGTLQAQSGGRPDLELVEGSARIGLTLFRGFTLSTGPYARAYTEADSTWREVVWQVRARLAAPIAGSGIAAVVEGWGAPAGRGAGSVPFDQARGGSVGLLYHPGTIPLGVRLAYAIDEARFAGGGRRHTVDGVTLAVSLGVR